VSITVQVLEKAKELLIEDGWTQASREDANGSRCATGAIQRAAILLDGRTRSSFTRLRVEHILASTINTPWDDAVRNDAPDMIIEDWNDEVGRTFQEVMAQFDAAILLAKEKERQQ
jgi:hypothetical protein